MPTQETRQYVAVALKAAENKKAEDITLLQLPQESSAFTDYFLICSGSNPRQVQAIADEIDERLSKDLGVEPNNREGYDTAEWILLDYVDFVVHIFNAQRRAYYDLERLWKSAERVTAEDLLKPEKPARKAAPTKAVAVRPAGKKLAARAKSPARKPAKKTSARSTSSSKKSVKATGRKATKVAKKKTTKRK